MDIYKRNLKKIVLDSLPMGVQAYIRRHRKEVDQLIASRQPKSYDRAVSLLEDLRDVAAMSGSREDFTRLMQGLVAQHNKKRSLIRRFRSTALVL